MSATVPVRPVESVTKVTVAFPFSTIRMAHAGPDETVQQLAELVAALAGELDVRYDDAVFADLAARARGIAHRD